MDDINTYTVLAAIATVAGASAAWFAAINGARTLRAARRHNANQSQPMVGAELRRDRHAIGVAHLVVRNFGPTIARDLKVTFDPPIGDPKDPQQSTIQFLKRRYSKTIDALLPGSELTNIWATPNDERPDVTATISYSGPDGEPLQPTTFQLSLDFMKETTFVTSSNDPNEQIKKIAQAVAEMAKR